MKKKILVLSLVIVFILSALSVSAGSLKDYIDTAFGNNNTETVVEITKSIGTDIEAKMSGETTYSNDPLEVNVGDVVDFKADVDLQEIKGVLETLSAMLATDGEVKNELSAATIEGSFTIEIKTDAGNNFTIPTTYNTGMSGFSAEEGKDLSLYEEEGRTWNAQNGTLVTTVTVAPGTTVEAAIAKVGNLSFELEGVIVNNPGTFVTEVKVKGSTTLKSSGKEVGKIIYNFKQKSTTGYDNNDPYIDPLYKNDNYVDETETPIPIRVTTECRGAWVTDSNIDDDGSITVDVNLANNPGISALNWELTYDDSIFVPVEDSGVVTDGTEFDTYGLEINTSNTVPGVVTLQMTSNDEENAVAVEDNGKICSVKFKVIDNLVKNDQTSADYSFGLRTSGIATGEESAEGERANLSTTGIDGNSITFKAVASPTMTVDGVTLTVTDGGNVTGGTYVMGTTVNIESAPTGEDEFLKLQDITDPDNTKEYTSEDFPVKILMIENKSLKVVWDSWTTKTVAPSSAYYFERSGTIKKLNKDSGSTNLHATMSSAENGSSLYTDDSNISTLFAKFSLEDITVDDVEHIYLSLLHSKVELASDGNYEFHIQEVSADDYNETLENNSDITETGSTFSKDNLPDGTDIVEITSGLIQGSSTNGQRLNTALTEYIKTAITKGQKTICFKIWAKRTYATKSTSVAIRTYDFMTGSHLIFTKADDVNVTFKNYDNTEYDVGITSPMAPYTMIKIPEGPVPSQEDYVFNGWKIEGDESSPLYYDTATNNWFYYVEDTNVTFKAESVKGAALTLKNCDNEGTTYYRPGTEVTLTTPVKTGIGTYTFTGWTDGEITYTAENVTANKAKITLNADTTLTAMWSYEAASSQTVNFDSKYLVKTGTYDSTNNVFDYTISDIATSNTNIGINNNKPSNGPSQFGYIKIDLTDAKQASEVKLNFNIRRNGGWSNVSFFKVDKIPTTVGEEVVVGDNLFAQVTSSDITLTDKEYTNVALTITDNYNQSIGKDLYLLITGNLATEDRKVGNLTINLGTINMTVTTSDAVTAYFGTDTKISATAGTEITIPAPETYQSGKVFGGWKLGEFTYQPGRTFTITENALFTPTWNEGGLDVNFISESGTKLITCATDGSVTLPDMESDKAGYEFSGWVLQGTTDELSAGTNVENITEGKTYVAVYKKNIYSDKYYAFLPEDVDVKIATEANKGTYTGTAYLNPTDEFKFNLLPLATAHDSGILAQMDLADVKDESIISASMTLSFSLRNQRYVDIYQVPKTEFDKFSTVAAEGTHYTNDVEDTTIVAKLPLYSKGTRLSRVSTGVSGTPAKTYDTPVVYDDAAIKTHITDEIDKGNDKVYLLIFADGGGSQTNVAGFGIKNFNTASYLTVKVLAQ